MYVRIEPMIQDYDYLTVALFSSTSLERKFTLAIDNTHIIIRSSSEVKNCLQIIKIILEFYYYLLFLNYPLLTGMEQVHCSAGTHNNVLVTIGNSDSN